MIDPQQDPQHMSQVQARHDSYAGAGAARLQARVEQIEMRAPRPARARLLKQALKAKTARQRVLWLRQEAELIGTAAAGVSPCRAGCGSCCHIAVLVSEPEAQAIGRAIGRMPAQIPSEHAIVAGHLMHEPDERVLARQQVLLQRHFGRPCTFLDAQGSCSIYPERPLACRLHLSLDDDDLLCRPVQGAEVCAPSLNTNLEKAHYLLALGVNSRLADLRDWFPGEGAAA